MAILLWSQPSAAGARCRSGSLCSLASVHWSLAFIPAQAAWLTYAGFFFTLLAYFSLSRVTYVQTRSSHAFFCQVLYA